MKKRLILIIITCLCLLLAGCDESKSSKDNNEKQDGQTIIPIRVFLYSFESDPDYSATFTEAEVYKAFERVDEIWSQAGIKWDIQSIEEKTISESKVPCFGCLDKDSIKTTFVDIAPVPMDNSIWTLVIIRKMPVNAGGFYAGQRYTSYYSELNPRGEHHPEVLAHELGHSLLGHEHPDIPGNLMSVGDPTQIVDLTAEQIAKAREQALIGPHGPMKDYI